jgi:hypothetical protein
MKYIKLYEDYYTEEYDVVIYPGNTFLRINAELKQKILAVVNGSLDFFEVKKGQYGNKDLKIYKEDTNLIFETPEGAKPTMEIEDVLFNLS